MHQIMRFVRAVNEKNLRRFKDTVICLRQKTNWALWSNSTAQT